MTAEEYDSLIRKKISEFNKKHRRNRKIGFGLSIVSFCLVFTVLFSMMRPAFGEQAIKLAYAGTVSDNITTDDTVKVHVSAKRSDSGIYYISNTDGQLLWSGDTTLTDSGTGDPYAVITADNGASITIYKYTGQDGRTGYYFNAPAADVSFDFDFAPAKDILKEEAEAIAADKAASEAAVKKAASKAAADGQTEAPADTGDGENSSETGSITTEEKTVNDKATDEDKSSTSEKDAETNTETGSNAETDTTSEKPSDDTAADTNAGEAPKAQPAPDTETSSMLTADILAVQASTPEEAAEKLNQYNNDDKEVTRLSFSAGSVVKDDKKDESDTDSKTVSEDTAASTASVSTASEENVSKSAVEPASDAAVIVPSQAGIIFTAKYVDADSKAIEGVKSETFDVQNNLDLTLAPQTIENYIYIGAKIGGVSASAINFNNDKYSYTDAEGRETAIKQDTSVYYIYAKNQPEAKAKSVDGELRKAVKMSLSVVDEFGTEIAPENYTFSNVSFDSHGIATLGGITSPVGTVKKNGSKMAYSYTGASVNGAKVIAVKKMPVSEVATVSAIKDEDGNYTRVASGKAVDAADDFDVYFYTVDGENWTEIKEDTALVLSYSDGTKTDYDYEDDDVKVTATLQKAGAVPSEAALKVTPVSEGTDGYNYDAYMAALNENAERIAANQGKDVPASYSAVNTKLYDVAFIVPKTDENGKTVEGEYTEVEPEEGSVKISIEFKNKTLTDDLKAEDGSDVSVVHLPLVKEVKDAIDTTADAQNITASSIIVEPVTSEAEVAGDSTGRTEDKLDVTLDSFSIMAITSSGEKKGDKIEPLSGFDYYLSLTGGMRAGDNATDASHYGIITNHYYGGSDSETNVMTDRFGLNNTIGLTADYVNQGGFYYIGDFDSGINNITLKGILPKAFILGDSAWNKYNNKEFTFQNLNNTEVINDNIDVGSIIDEVAKYYKTIYDIKADDNVVINNSKTDIDVDFTKLGSNDRNKNYLSTYTGISMPDSDKCQVRFNSTDQKYVINVSPQSKEFEVHKNKINGIDAATLSGMHTTDNHDIDKYIESFILNFGSYNGTVRLKEAFAGTIIAPNATVIVDGTGCGRIVAKNVDQESGEWHYHDHELPTTLYSGISISGKKTVNGGIPTADQTFKFQLDRMSFSNNYKNFTWESVQSVNNSGENFKFNDIEIKPENNDFLKDPYAWPYDDTGLWYSCGMNFIRDPYAWPYDDTGHQLKDQAYYCFKVTETQDNNHPDMTFDTSVYGLRYLVTKHIDGSQTYYTIGEPEIIKSTSDDLDYCNSFKVDKSEWVKEVAFNNTTNDNKLTFELTKLLDLKDPGNKQFVFFLKARTYNDNKKAEVWKDESWTFNKGSSVSFDDYFKKDNKAEFATIYKNVGVNHNGWIIYRAQELVPSSYQDGNTDPNTAEDDRKVVPQDYVYYDHNNFIFMAFKVDKDGNVLSKPAYFKGSKTSSGDLDPYTEYKLNTSASYKHPYDILTGATGATATMNVNERVLNNWTTTKVEFTKKWAGTNVSKKTCYFFISGTTPDNSQVYGKVVSLDGKTEGNPDRVTWDKNNGVDRDNTNWRLGHPSGESYSDSTGQSYIPLSYVGGEDSKWHYIFDDRYPEINTDNKPDRNSTNKDILFNYTTDGKPITYRVFEIDQPDAKSVSDIVDESGSGHNGTEWKSFLPKGCVYSSDSMTSDNYKVTYGSTLGGTNPVVSVVDSTPCQVTITNSQNLVLLPNTGGKGTRAYAMFGSGAMLIALAGFAGMAFKKRKQVI